MDVDSSMLKTLRYGAKNVDVWKGGEAMERTWTEKELHIKRTHRDSLHNGLKAEAAPSLSKKMIIHQGGKRYLLHILRHIMVGRYTLSGLFLIFFFLRRNKTHWFSIFCYFKLCCTKHSHYLSSNLLCVYRKDRKKSFWCFDKTF